MTDKTTSWFDKNPKKTFFILSVIFILVIELLLQLYFYFRHNYFLFNNPFKINYINRTYDEREYNLKKNYESSLYRINKYGYRGKFFNNPLILMLGDSVPFGANVRNNETHPYYLYSEYGLEVANGGIPSYTIWQSLERWKKDFKNIKPKVVTIQAANDISLLSFYQSKWHPKLTWLDKRFSNIYRYNIALFHYFNRIWHKLHKSKNKYCEVTNNKLINKFFKNISASLDRAISYANEINVILIFIPINPFYYLNDIEKSKKMKLWNKGSSQYYYIWNTLVKKTNFLMREKSGDHPNVYYFDIVTEMDQRNREDLFVDVLHHSPKGNKLFAYLFYHFLKDNELLFDRREAPGITYLEENRGIVGNDTIRRNKK